MKYILIVIFTTACFISQAQKCKFDYEKKDAFSGKIIYKTQCDLNRSWKVAVFNNGGAYGVSLGLRFAGIRADVIRKGDSLMFAIENLPPLVFIASVDCNPVALKLGTSVATSYQPMYSATKDQLLQLSKNKIVAYRFVISGIVYSNEISQKNAEKLSKAAGCIGTTQ